MAAFGALTLSLLSQGDKLIVPKTLYLNTVASDSVRTALAGMSRAGQAATACSPAGITAKAATRPVAQLRGESRLRRGSQTQPGRS
jgi:hypothetical protein